MVHAEDFCVAKMEGPHLGGPRARPQPDPHAGSDTVHGPAPGVSYCDQWCRLCESCSPWRHYDACRGCGTPFDSDAGPPSPRSYLAPPMPLGDPLSAVDVARFLALPIHTQLQVILRGPLRPPSATPSHMRASDALAYYRRLVTGPAPQGAGGAGLMGGTYYGSHDMVLRAAPMIPPGSYAIAAPPGAVPYLLPSYRVAGGDAEAAPPPAAAHQPHSPGW